MSNPTLINNAFGIRQCIDFKNLKYGSWYPTDVDGLMEVKNKFYIFFELKHKTSELSTGQELALTRLCDDLQRLKPAYLIVAEHTTIPPDDIDAGKALVRKYYYMGEWRDPINGICLHDAVRLLLDKHLRR